MSKRMLFILVFATTTCSTFGQVAKWLIPPLYNDIHMTNGEDLIVTDSLDQKTIWSQTGTRLATTGDQEQKSK